jgi:hypothetical protein
MTAGAGLAGREGNKFSEREPLDLLALPFPPPFFLLTFGGMLVLARVQRPRRTWRTRYGSST